jgi:hypothetical protein
VKFDGQPQEDEDEELLEADTSHVDVNTFHNFCFGVVGTCPAASYKLYYE